DWVEFRKCDIAFHREICRASGNEIVLKLWEALAQHITIIFGRELASERNFGVVIDQHRKLLEMFERADDSIERVIENHIVRYRTGWNSGNAISPSIARSAGPRATRSCSSYGKRSPSTSPSSSAASSPRSAISAS